MRVHKVDYDNFGIEDKFDEVNYPIKVTVSTRMHDVEPVDNCMNVWATTMLNCELTGRGLFGVQLRLWRMARARTLGLHKHFVQVISVNAGRRQ